MITGQTVFTVRKGTEHRAEAALAELQRLFAKAGGLNSFKVLRSFGMSPIGSALHDEAREADLGYVHFVVQTEWESIQTHDAFFRGPAVSQAYALLSSILTSGPYEVLYRSVVDRSRSGVTA